MADPFSLATGVISLVVITLNAIAGVSRMLDKTIAAHRDADEELERLRRNLEDLQGRMESNHGRLEGLASNTKDRGFKKVLQSDAGQAAVVRLCQALKETHNTLKRLTDQTVSEEATLRANVLPSKKRSLAFVRAVLKYNVSPQTIDEMISNLRQMQTEILDCLRNLETSFDNVDNLHDLFQQQLERFSTYSRLSTSTTLTNRVQLVSWLGKFGERREFPQRSQNEKSKRLHTFLRADQDEDGDTSSTESLLDTWTSVTPPPLPSPRLPNTVPLHPNGLNLPTRVKTAQRRVRPQPPRSDTGTGGRNVSHYFVPPNVPPRSPLTGSGARKPYTSINSQPRVPMRPPPIPPQSDWAKHQQLFAVKLRELQTQAAALEEELNRALGSAKSNEEIQKAMKKYHRRMKDLWRDRGGELDESEQTESDDGTNPAPTPVPSRPVIKTIPLFGTNTPTRPRAARKISFDVPHRPEHDPYAVAAAPKKHRHRRRPTNLEDDILVDPFGFTITESTRYDVIEKVTAGKNNVQPEPQFPTYRENFAAKTNALRAQADAKERGRQEDSMLRRGVSLVLRRRRYSPSRVSPRGSPEPSSAPVERTQRWAWSPFLNNEEAKEVKDPWRARGGKLDLLEQSDDDDENPPTLRPVLPPPRPVFPSPRQPVFPLPQPRPVFPSPPQPVFPLPRPRPVLPLPPPQPVFPLPVPYRLERDSPAAAAAPKKRRHRGRPTNPEDNMLVDPFVFTLTEGKRYDVVEKVTARKKSVQPEPQFPTYRENFTARTNALQAQEEAEARERGRQEGSMLRRGASLVYRRHSPEPSPTRVERMQRWVPSPPLNNEEKDLWRDRRGELNELEQSDNDDETSPAPSPVPPRPVRIKPIPAARDVSHRHDSPAAAPMKRGHRHRGRPTDPEDNMLVDPFVFTITEGTRYDAIEKVTVRKNVQPEPQFPTYRENFTAKTNALRAQEEAEARKHGRQEDSMLHRGGSLVLRRRRHSSSPGSPRGSPEPSAARVERTQRWATPPPLNNEGLKELRDLWRDRRASLDELEQSYNDDDNPAPPPVSFRPMPTTMPLTSVDPIARVERTQRWMPPQNTNSDSGTGGGTVNHYPQTGSDALKPSTSIHSQLQVPMHPPVPTRPPLTPPQSDWAKQQQLIAVKLHEWQTQGAIAEGELNITPPAAENNEEIQKAMEKYHNPLKDLLRDRAGESDEFEQFVNGSAISAHSGDDEEEPEGDELAEVEEPTGLRGFDCMELAMNGQESPDPDVEIPDNDSSSDASPPTPPPTENDEDYRAAQRRINMKRSRDDRTLAHTPARRAKLAPATGAATPTRSRPTNVATLTELAMDGERLLDPEEEIPGSDNLSDASPPTPPPTENDEDYRVAQRRIIMRRLRVERTMSHASARLAKLTTTNVAILMELAINGQESPNLEVEIPGSDDSSDTPPPTPPPKENDEGYRAAQRRINMQSSRGERILVHGRAELAPATSGTTPTRSSPTTIATPLHQSPSNSKVSSFLSPSEPATPIQPAAPLPKGNPSLSRAKSPRLQPETPTLELPMSKPPDNLNWRQIIEGSLHTAEHWSHEYDNF